MKNLQGEPLVKNTDGVFEQLQRWDENKIFSNFDSAIKIVIFV